MSSVKENHPDARGGPDAAPARAAVDEARRLLQSGDADSAAATLRSFATRAEAPPAELSDAAKVMADAGSPADAVSRYLEAGRGFLDAENAPQARQNFAAAYEIDGKNMDALFELGRVDVAEGKRHDALDKFVEVLRKSNLKHLPALYEAGVLYELDGQHNQAILAFKRVVERDKTHVKAFEHLGNLHNIRNQLPEAVANFVKAAEAAQVRYQYAEAKRLAQAALDIDSANATARRVLGEAEKAIEAGLKPGHPPAQQAAPAPSATEHRVSTPVSDVSSVVPPSAEGPMPPPPPPSTLTIGLPSDVALLEQQSQAMAQLAQVQNAVAQTYRQRMALDEEIKRAQAALEALHRQQESVDEDLSGKRDELAKAVADREAEEAALAELGDAIAKTKTELETLASLPATIADVRAKCASAADLVVKTSNEVGGVAGQSNDVREKAVATDAAIKELQKKLAAARQAAEAHERQLSDLAGGIKSAHEVVAAAGKQIEETKRSLDSLSAGQRAVEAVNDELASASKHVAEKLNQASAAIKRLEALQAQRKSQFEEVVFTLTPLVGDVAGRASSAPAKAAPAAPSAAPATAPAAPAAAPATPPAAKSAPVQKPSPAAAGAAVPASVDSLISAGKFAEATQRAQTEANAQPKPAEYLVAVGAKLRTAGRVDDAVKLFASARDRDQNNARARYELGSALVELGKPDEALSVLHTVEADPEFIVLGQVAIGKCLRRQGDLEAAEARFSKALEAEGRPDDDYHQALYQLADLHESKGDPESLGLALWSWEELQTGNPNYGDVAQRVTKLKAQLADAGARSEPTRNGAVKQ
jgi:tetratricopeptide (TPR) repeat protein